MKKIAALLLVGLAFVGCGDGKKDGESAAPYG